MAGLDVSCYMGNAWVGPSEFFFGRYMSCKLNGSRDLDELARNSSLSASMVCGCLGLVGLRPWWPLHFCCHVCLWAVLAVLAEVFLISVGCWLAELIGSAWFWLL